MLILFKHKSSAALVVNYATKFGQVVRLHMVFFLLQRISHNIMSYVRLLSNNHVVTGSFSSLLGLDLFRERLFLLFVSVLGKHSTSLLFRIASFFEEIFVMYPCFRRK